MANVRERVSLADAISSLRNEIQQASQRAQALNPGERYRIAEASIELAVIADDAAEAGAEVGWWVLKAKAGLSSKDSHSQKVTIKLDLRDVEVSSGRTTL